MLFYVTKERQKAVKEAMKDLLYVGMAWCMCLYGSNGLVEFCLQIHKRNYAYDGGERALAAFDIFYPSGFYDGAWEWPSEVKLSDEEREETTQLMTDLNTYYQYLQEGAICHSSRVSR